MVGPIGRLPYDFICKVQEKALGIPSQSLSMQRWAGKANTGQNKGRQPEGSYSIIGRLLLILRLTQCSHHACQSAQQGRGGCGRWGGGKRRSHSSCLTFAYTLVVPGLCSRTLIIHCSEVSRHEGTRHASSWFPNPPVSSNTCITPLPCTQLWQVLHQHLLPEACPV